MISVIFQSMKIYLATSKYYNKGDVKCTAKDAKSWPSLSYFKARRKQVKMKQNGMHIFFSNQDQKTLALNHG